MHRFHMNHEYLLKKNRYLPQNSIWFKIYVVFILKNVNILPTYFNIYIQTLWWKIILKSDVISREMPWPTKIIQFWIKIEVLIKMLISTRPIHQFPLIMLRWIVPLLYCFIWIYLIWVCSMKRYIYWFIKGISLRNFV